MQVAKYLSHFCLFNHHFNPWASIKIHTPISILQSPKPRCKWGLHSTFPRRTQLLYTKLNIALLCSQKQFTMCTFCSLTAEYLPLGRADLFILINCFASGSPTCRTIPKQFIDCIHHFSYSTHRHKGEFSCVIWHADRSRTSFVGSCLAELLLF